MSGSNQFQALLEELDTMSKAMACADNDGGGDKKISAAASDGASGGSSDGGDGKGGAKQDADDEKGKDDGEAFGKSFAVTLADGTEMQVVDGTEMMKALMERNQTLEASVTALTGQNQELGDAFTKSLGFVKALQEQIVSQGGLLKSLRLDLDALRNQGAGRKAVVSVLDKPAPTTMAKAEGIQPRDLLNKALTAQRDGRMTASDVARIEAHLNRGEAPPASLIKAALSG